MLHSESIANIAPALVAASKQFTAVSKDATNPFFNSKYADITAILDMVKPILAEHDLAILQLPAPTTGNSVGIHTVLVHASGEWISDFGLEMRASKDDPQGYGAAMTYGRRYALLAFFSLATEDDDGNTAVQALSKVEQAKLKAQQKGAASA